MNKIAYTIPGVDFPPIPDSCTPDHLADFLLHFTRSSDPAVAGLHDPTSMQFSEVAFRKLLNLAYSASMMPEEGIYPVLRIVIVKHSAFDVSLFEVSVDTPEQLRKLAPIAQAANCALIITERTITQIDGTTASSLVCQGITIYAQELVAGVGRPEFHSTGGYSPVTLSILGPGRIRAGIWGWCAAELFAGRIRQIVDFNLVPGVRDLLEGIERTVMTSIASQLHGEDQKLFGGSPNSIVHWVLSRILRLTLDRKHGGSFVFLPGAEKAEDAARFEVKGGIPATVDLGNQVADYWVKCATSVLAKDDNTRRNADRQWLFAREQLKIKTEIASDFANADGCVVIGSNMSILSFGSKIHLSSIEDPVKQPYNVAKKERVPASSALPKGTRHSSALALCQHNPGVVVFVISQDCELRVIYSDDKNVYIYESLDTRLFEPQQNA